MSFDEGTDDVDPSPPDGRATRPTRSRRFAVVVTALSVVALLAAASIIVVSTSDRYLNPVMVVGPGDQVHISWTDRHIGGFGDDDVVASRGLTAPHPGTTATSVGWLLSDFAVAPDGSTIYAITSRGLVVTSASRRDATTTVPNTADRSQNRRVLSISPDGRRVYLCRPDRGRIDVLDAGTLTAARSPIPVRAFGIVVSPDGERLYASTVDGIAVINTSTGEAVGPRIPATGFDMVISRDGRRIAVLTEDQKLDLVDTATAGVVRSSEPVGDGFGLAISPDGSRAYVSRVFDRSIVAIDTTTGGRVGEPIRPATAQEHPVGLALNPEGNLLIATIATVGSNGWDSGDFDRFGPVQDIGLMMIDTATLTQTGATIQLGR